MSVNERNALFPEGVGFSKARDVCVKDILQRIIVVVHRPLSLGSVPRERVSPRVGVKVVDEADPVAVHEASQVAVRLGLVLKRWNLG